MHMLWLEKDSIHFYIKFVVVTINILSRVHSNMDNIILNAQINENTSYTNFSSFVNTSVRFFNSLFNF